MSESSFAGMPVPRVEWDSDAKAAYLRLVEEWPEFVTQIEKGGCIFDVNYYDDSQVLGVEMLMMPVGEAMASYGEGIPSSVWVMAGRAWELVRPLLENKNTGVTGTTGAFTLMGALG